MNQGIFFIVLSFFLIISKKGSLESWSKSILCKDGFLPNSRGQLPPVTQATLFLSPLSYLHAPDNWIEKNISVHLGFPCGSAGKESTCNAGDLGLIPGLGRPPGEENGYPLQYSGLENSMDCIWLSNFHFPLSDMDYSSFLEIYKHCTKRHYLMSKEIKNRTKYPMLF